MDYTALARDVRRAMRGQRSQVAFSRRLGYATNVAYTWESSRPFPTAAETFRAARRVGIDVHRALELLFRQVPSELLAVDPTTPAFAAALLRALRSKARVKSSTRNEG